MEAFRVCAGMHAWAVGFATGIRQSDANQAVKSLSTSPETSVSRKSRSE
jgi:hypothetical protein